MTRDSAREMPAGVIMERAVRWGVPTAPLFAAMLQALATTPASLSAASASASYLVCMTGALFGFALVAFVRNWTLPIRRGMCWGGAALLEAAWVVLTIGTVLALPTCTLAGMALVGLSTATLLCLWLSVDQWRDPRCEISKLAVGLVCAFLLNTILSVVPYLNWASFALPLLVALPLEWRLRVSRIPSTPKDPDPCGCESASLRVTQPGDSVARTSLPTLISAELRRQLCALPLLTALGAGVGVLGYGGTIVDYGAVLGALVLLIPLLLGKSAHAAIGQLAAPLAVTGVGLGFLLESGAPFSIFLSGCAALLAWLWTDCRAEEGGLTCISPRLTATVLGLANMGAMIGLAAEQLIVHTGVMGISQLMVLLCIVLVGCDALWRLALLARDTRVTHGMHVRMGLSENGDAKHFHVTRSVSLGASYVDEATLTQRFGLSAREAQVACLLCENRSVNYVCACLELSRSTVKTHVRHIYEKAGVHSKDELQLLVREATLGKES